ncbi:helix-turn-helix domain-containing protein [Methanothermobacter wolfeii]|uniref:Cupin domain-containing protein n=1 Tax=Methanothermobacter wolfeii TaxID=145261 RepID=A0A9E7RR66_METWO|nr:cupin domain-containing protein [Methanothermobacter wolfeii]MDI6701362.1 cupin domain-containing protein [Methanothermobacter wolfeii]MDI6842021.1 cupin domain-containing protein [Methanothermobacter wolfeii]NLM03168.1 cupin domain-containing protein [Methanothermobacter wolfeii]UXH31000.1 cupin domain-containing protein [Methanothermobacter wolfeii]SCM57449.1 putative transcriptional regulator {ECO:0000313/EMBL:ADL58682,1} [Methanothermobacter wolfeii]
MKEKSKEIGSRIKELRELSEISPEEMADYLKIDVESYMKYESGEEDIPASILFEIAHKLGVDMGLLLTGEETRMHIFTVTRKGKGVEVERRKQYRYENLAEKFIHKKAEPFIVTVEPRDGKPKTNSHPGQEFNYVLEGRIRFYIHDNEIILNEGDSIFFDSSYEHAMEALDGKRARFLAIIM